MKTEEAPGLHSEISGQGQLISDNIHRVPKLYKASVTILADFGPEFNPPFSWRSKHQTKYHTSYH